MKFTRDRVIAAVLVALLAATVVIAHSVRAAEMGGGGVLSGHMVRFFTNYLDLTDAQQAQVQQILQKDKPALQPLMQQMHQSREQMRQLIESGVFDETKARALVSQQTQAMTELAVQKAKMESDLYQVLTADQKTKLDKFLDRHEARFSKQSSETPTNQ
jgi:Spy/CpxP family protein refolding chaperone